VADGLVVVACPGLRLLADLGAQARGVEDEDLAGHVVKLPEADELAAGVVEHRTGVRLLPDVVAAAADCGDVAPLHMLSSKLMRAATLRWAESKAPSNPRAFGDGKRVSGTVRASAVHCSIPAGRRALISLFLSLSLARCLGLSGCERVAVSTSWGRNRRRNLLPVR
jgi:hypothetical protein